MCEMSFVFLDYLIETTDYVVYLHWHIRKKYQTFLYKFNAYHGLKVWKLRLLKLSFKIEFRRTQTITFFEHTTFIKFWIVILEKIITEVWYTSWWLSWCWLTYYLYYHEQSRDLGPSYDIYDYNPEDDMGIYRTIGPVLLFVWGLWTFSANTAFLTSINFILNKLFFTRVTWYYWYEVTVYSYIKTPLINYFMPIYETNLFIFQNSEILANISDVYYYNMYHQNFFKISEKIISNDIKIVLLWFPWASFFNYITVLGLIYTLIFYNIYSTENTYYLVLYTVFLIFVFSANLVMLDLDIFAGLLLLIESVVVLMLFFLIIYLTPNINLGQKINKWKVFSLFFIILLFLSRFSYVNLGYDYFYNFSNSIYFLDDFYEALNETSANDLTGIYTSLYWTNSILLLIIGVLLLIASIICVVLVAYFTKNRNFNLKVFLEIFNIAKNCYSYVFLRKQNLAKQGRALPSTRIVNKKTFDSTLHNEYKTKHEFFEKKKKNTK